MKYAKHLSKRDQPVREGRLSNGVPRQVSACAGAAMPRTKQVLLPVATVGLLSIALTACSNDARPDSYWLKHPEEAKQRIARCKSDDTNIKQAIATKPPSALSALQRECLYLVYSGDYRRDKRGSDKMTTVSSVIDAKQAADASDENN